MDAPTRDPSPLFQLSLAKILELGAQPQDCVSSRFLLLRVFPSRSLNFCQDSSALPTKIWNLPGPGEVPRWGGCGNQRVVAGQLTTWLPGRALERRSSAKQALRWRPRARAVRAAFQARLEEVQALKRCHAEARAASGAPKHLFDLIVVPHMFVLLFYRISSDMVQLVVLRGNWSFHPPMCSQVDGIYSVVPLQLLRKNHRASAREALAE